MKICFWIGNAYYRKAGTNKIVSTIANVLAKNHDVSILVTVDEIQENIFEYDERIKIEKLQAANFVYRKSKKDPVGFMHACIRVINNRTGFFNNSQRYKLLKKAFYAERYTTPLESFFQSKDYDVIIATGSEIMWLAVLSENINSKTKLIGWQHNSYDSYVTRKNILFWKKEEIVKRYIPKLDRLIVLNPYDKEVYLENLGIDVGFIGNPLTIQSEIKTDPMNKQFILVGRLADQKGIDLLLESFALFAEQNDDWKLVIVGDGKAGDRDELIKLAWEKEIQARVRFVGFTTDVMKYYLQSSIYLMTSRYEGWGLVVTEAMQLGLPVIAYDITPMEYIIDHTDNGLIVEKFDTKKYAVAMLKLANDYDMRSEMATAAIKKSEQFSLDVAIQEWLQLFNEVEKI